MGFFCSLQTVLSCHRTSTHSPWLLVLAALFSFILLAIICCTGNFKYWKRQNLLNCMIGLKDLRMNSNPSLYFLFGTEWGFHQFPLFFSQITKSIWSSKYLKIWAFWTRTTLMRLIEKLATHFSVSDAVSVFLLLLFCFGWFFFFFLVQSMSTCWST